VIVMVLAAWATGPLGRFSVDEGLYIAQVRSLVQHGTWALSKPFPLLDPQGITFPLPHSPTFAVYAKHPLYPVLLTPLYAVGGIWAMLGLSIAGTVLAASLAAALSRRFMTGIDRWVFWAVGIGGPLLFDGLTIFAHSLAAAAATAVVLGVVEYRRSGLRRWLILAVANVGPAVLLRSEALLLFGALAAVLLLLGVRRGERRSTVAALVVGGAAFVARAADQLWASAIGGAGMSLTADGPSGGDAGWFGRVHVAWTTLLGTALPWVAGAGPALLLAAMAFSCVAIRGVHRHRPPLLVGGCWSLAVVAWGGAVLLGPWGDVPGLLVVCPVLAAGIVAALAPPLPVRERAIGMAILLFVGAVVTTEYDIAGGSEWGARFLAIVVPTATAMAVCQIARLLRRRPPAVARMTIGALVVGSLLVAGLSLTTLRHDHQRSVRNAVEIQRQAEASVPGDGGLPVVVTTDPWLARRIWPLEPRLRIVLVDGSEAGSWGRRLRQAGFRQVVVVQPRWPPDSPPIVHTVDLGRLTSGESLLEPAN
jgi:hypothetical protein